MESKTNELEKIVDDEARIIAMLKGDKEAAEKYNAAMKLALDNAGNLGSFLELSHYLICKSRNYAVSVRTENERRFFYAELKGFLQQKIDAYKRQVRREEVVPYSEIKPETLKEILDGAHTENSHLN